MTIEKKNPVVVMSHFFDYRSNLTVLTGQSFQRLRVISSLVERTCPSPL